MRVGITGHQSRPGLDWPWVSSEIRRCLLQLEAPLEGYSSLAAGADQVFADSVLALGGKSMFVLPHSHIEDTLHGPDLQRFRALRHSSDEIRFPHALGEEESYLYAGKWIALNVEALIAVWDGKPAAGRGGTADIVEYARALGRPIFHIDTTKKVAGWI